LIVENKIFNLESLGIKNVDVEYNVQDFSGKSFFSEKENLVVENQILVTKSINLPGRMLPGDYALSVVVRYEESVGTSSYFFKITEKSIELKSSSFPLSFWFVIVAIVGIMFFFMAYIRQKDKLFLELENQRRRELKKEMRELAKEREKIHRMREGKRRRALSNLTKKRKKRAKAIQKIHKRRVKVLRQLKKQKRKSEMQKKLAEWKKEGYNIEEFLINEKNEKKSKEKRVKEYKKQGYKM